MLFDGMHLYFECVTAVHGLKYFVLGVGGLLCNWYILELFFFVLYAIKMHTTIGTEYKMFYRHIWFAFITRSFILLCTSRHVLTTLVMNVQMTRNFFIKTPRCAMQNGYLFICLEAYFNWSIMFSKGSIILQLYNTV